MGPANTSLTEVTTKRTFVKRDRSGVVVRTLKFRLKDKHAKVLRQMAYEVNQVWNACNAFAAPEPIPGFGWYTPSLNRVSVREPAVQCVKERGLKLHSQTVQMVSNAFRLRRDKALKTVGKAKLKYRKSSGKERSLGWVPFCGQALRVTATGKFSTVRFNGYHFTFWDSHGVEKYELRDGSFSEDSLGRWYFNVAVEIPIENGSGTEEVGIDLGLKNVATYSNGTHLKKGDWYRKVQGKIAIAQRAKKAKRLKALHKKAANQRKDYLHKASTALVESASLIVMGDVSSAAMVKTKMAKSALDSGWGIFRSQLEYKAIGRRVVCIEASERNSTRICSCCGEIPSNSPKGRAELGIREWSCELCGARHHRDVNAARNILAAGRRRLAEGIPAS